MQESLISVRQAIGILDAIAVNPRVRRLGLGDAQGFRLAQDVYSDRDDPPFDKSLMDGYAVRSADVASAPIELRVIETVAAGDVASHAVGPHEAMAIMTGAPIPSGADAVVQVEHTMREGNMVVLHRAVKPGQAIAYRGNDVRAGTLVLRAGDRLGPAQIAVAAGAGASEVSVYARPVVAVLSTGNELVEIDQVPRGGQIRNSNSPMMIALLRQMGCDARSAGVVRDEFDVVVNAIAANAKYDALFITGGMSMGEFDFVPKALVKLGAVIDITKLRIKPGKPFVYARLARQDGGECHIFGLPGNPVSAFVCTVRLASRVLSRLAGGSPDAAVVQARLTLPLAANGNREFYQPAIRTGTNVEPLTWKGSADIYTLARANALIIRAENASVAAGGEWVDLLDLSDG
jgi:molybdopterin molybdotransferase